MLIDENTRFMWRVAPKILMASCVNLRIAALSFMRDIYKVLDCFTALFFITRPLNFNGK